MREVLHSVVKILDMNEQMRGFDPESDCIPEWTFDRIKTVPEAGHAFFMSKFSDPAHLLHHSDLNSNPSDLTTREIGGSLGAVNMSEADMWRVHQLIRELCNVIMQQQNDGGYKCHSLVIRWLA